MAAACMSLESAQVAVQAFTEQSMAFQTKMVANGGLGQETYLPDGEPFLTSSLLNSLPT